MRSDIVSFRIFIGVFVVHKFVDHKNVDHKFVNRNHFSYSAITSSRSICFSPQSSINLWSCSFFWP